MADKKLTKKKVDDMWASVKEGALRKAGWPNTKKISPTSRNIKRLNFLANFSGDPATKAKARAAVNRMKKKKA